MEDNTEEEHSDNPINSESENSPTEIIPIAEQKTIKPNQETENMEVHHHAHDPAAPHHQKNWKNYFWEFLMLFLAVFCGFLAEYQLEHKIERDREKVYINNLYEDLKDDVVHFSEYDKVTREFLITIDSMMILMKSNERNLHLRRIYYLSRNATVNPINFFTYNSRTYEQMKHAGQLRLIRNQPVANSISSYYFSLQRLDFQNDIIKDRIADYMQMIGKVFDAQVLFQIYQDKEELTNNTLKFMTSNPQNINMFLTSAQYFYGARKIQKELCDERGKRAQILLDLIKKEYHLENETQ